MPTHKTTHLKSISRRHTKSDKFAKELVFFKLIAPDKTIKFGL